MKFILALFLTAAAFGADDLIDGVNYTFANKCKLQVPMTPSPLGIPSSVQQYNPECDHQWALRNAESIYYVHEKHTKKILDIVRKSSDVQSLTNDGLCVPGESLQDCKDRWERQAFAASLETREKTLKYNKTELDLAPGSRVKIGTTKRAGAVDDKTTVLNDLYRASQKTLVTPYKLFSPKQIQFSPPPIFSNGNVQMMNSETQKLNDQVIKDQIGAKNQTDIETESQTKNTRLEKSVNKALDGKGKVDTLSRKKFESDDQRLHTYVEGQNKSGSQIQVRGQGNASVRAFKDVMDDVQKDAISTQTTGPGGHQPAGLADQKPTDEINGIPQVGMKRGPGNAEYELENSLIKNGVNPNDP